MDSITSTVAVTFCLLGSSAMAYAYAASIYGEKSKQLEKKLEMVMSDQTTRPQERVGVFSKV